MIEATADEIVTVLHNARALIDRPWGWTKGRFRTAARNGGTCYCAVGAVESATGGRFEATYRGAKRALSEVLHQTAGDDFNPHGLYSVVEFNDAPTTKKKDVLALFDRAVDIVKNGA